MRLVLKKLLYGISNDQPQIQEANVSSKIQHGKKYDEPIGINSRAYMEQSWEKILPVKPLELLCIADHHNIIILLWVYFHANKFLYGWNKLATFGTSEVYFTNS